MKNISVLLMVFALLFGATTDVKAGDEIWRLGEDVSESGRSSSFWLWFFMGAAAHDVSHEMAHMGVAQEGQYSFDCGPFYAYLGKSCLGDRREGLSHKKRFYTAGLMSSMALTDRMLASGRKDPQAMGIIARGIADQIIYPSVHLLGGGHGDFQSWEKAGGSRGFAYAVLGVGVTRLGLLAVGINPPRDLGISISYDQEIGEMSLLYTRRF